MPLRSSRPQAKPQKRSRPSDEEREQRPEEEKDEGEEDCYPDLRLPSVCPSCRHGFDVALLLPCSHTLCGRCIRSGEEAGQCHPPHGASSGRRTASTPVCAVLCPCCRHPVELPCWEWASATCCLPHDPTLSPGWNAFQQAQVDTFCMDTGDVTAQSFLDESSSASSQDGTIDLQDEDMEKSVSGLSFALDPSTSAPSLHLSHSSLAVTFQGPSHPSLLSHDLPNGDMGSGYQRQSKPLPQVCADVIISRGQFYWEVDVCNSTLYRIGVSSLGRSHGWWMERRGMSFFTEYADGHREPLHAVPPQLKTLGVFLNMGGGALSFHNPLTQEHLATLPTRFSPTGVTPALGLGQGRLRLRCGLPPPPHVFLSRASAYRGPLGAGRGRWRRDVDFQSVRNVIQKFEELAVSDSDSGLVSSLGSSCSTLASLPDPGRGPGTVRDQLSSPVMGDRKMGWNKLWDM